jgi:hypothetical protein
MPSVSVASLLALVQTMGMKVEKDDAGLWERTDAGETKIGRRGRSRAFNAERS